MLTFTLYDIRKCNLFYISSFSDGSGPKSTGPGRARALKVGLGPGPGLSPSLKAGPQANTKKNYFFPKFIKVDILAKGQNI